MKPFTSFLLLLLVLVSSAALHAQTDSSQSTVIKVRKADNICSPYDLLTDENSQGNEEFVMLIYKNGNKPTDSALFQQWRMRIGQSFVAWRLVLTQTKTVPRLDHIEGTWEDDYGVFKMNMSGFRFTGQCMVYYIAGRVMEDDKVFGSFRLLSWKDYQEELRAGLHDRH